MRDRIIRIIREMGGIFVRKHVGRSAAALSYYLTLSVFPFLVCLSTILGFLNVYEGETFSILEEVIPSQAFSVIIDFLRYAGGNRSELMLIVGIIAMLTTSSAAFRSFTGIMTEIQGQSRFSSVWRGIVSFALSIAFIAAIYVSGLIIITGRWLVQVFEPHVGVSDFFSHWPWIRFLFLFLLLFGVIFGVYIISAPKETKRTHRLPGALAASVVLVAASILYARMISASLRYTLLYGSLASFVILMIWLYTCGIILIMGNVFNISLHKQKN